MRTVPRMGRQQMGQSLQRSAHKEQTAKCPQGTSTRYVKRFVVAHAAENIRRVRRSSTLPLGLRLRHTGLLIHWQPDRTGAALRHECPLELHYRLASWRLESGATCLGMLWLKFNLSLRCEQFCRKLSAGARQISLLRSKSHSRAGHHLQR